MPSLSGAWGSIRRFFTGTGTRPGADPETGCFDGIGIDSCYGEPTSMPTAGRRLAESCERIREQLQEAHRKNEVAKRDAMRRDRRAKRRALTLLLKLLNPQQRQEFRANKYFHVTGGSSGDRYRIQVGRIANIEILDGNGKVKCRLCIHPVGDVPVYDVMAAQLLHLQDPGAEERFLYRANVLPALTENRLGSRAEWIA
ncbi:MAG: hypothetical protein JWQ23_110 [Herminiimonas sp.]|nr:hypothetical protein [Herminiimonas sp.]